MKKRSGAAGTRMNGATSPMAASSSDGSLVGFDAGLCLAAFRGRYSERLTATASVYAGTRVDDEEGRLRRASGCGLCRFVRATRNSKLDAAVTRRTHCAHLGSRRVRENLPTSIVLWTWRRRRHGEPHTHTHTTTRCSTVTTRSQAPAPEALPNDPTPDSCPTVHPNCVGADEGHCTRQTQRNTSEARSGSVSVSTCRI